MSNTTPSTPPAGEQRRLAAIVFTDVVGYSARMQRDETGTMKLVAADFALMRERCAQHGGELLNSMGDGLLLCFGSAVQAVACALQIQAEFAARRAKLPPEEALEHRMGVHIGDVFRQETGGVAGDGVNIAARRALQLSPGGAGYHAILAFGLIGQKRYAEAEAEFALEDNPIEAQAAAGLMALSRGQVAAARQSLEQLENIARTNRDGADLQMAIAWIRTGLGDKAGAFAALEVARASRDPSMSWLRNGPHLQALHSDPRWDALVRQVGLADDQLK